MNVNPRNIFRTACLALATVALLQGGVACADEWNHRFPRGYREHEYREHEFRDARYLDAVWGHNRYYPPLGYGFFGLPAGYLSVSVGGGLYYFQGGVWYAHVRQGHYVVVGAPLGAVLPFLPPYSTQLWVGGVPYYYVNGTYYLQTPQGYAVVQPPPLNMVSMQPPPGAPAPGNPMYTAPPPPPPVTVAPPPMPAGNPAVTELPPVAGAPASAAPVFVYPRQGQSAQATAQDRAECERWAAGQSGAAPSSTGAAQDNFRRALGACLDARGYTVR